MPQTGTIVTLPPPPRHHQPKPPALLLNSPRHANHRMMDIPPLSPILLLQVPLHQLPNLHQRMRLNRVLAPPRPRHPGQHSPKRPHELVRILDVIRPRGQRHLDVREALRPEVLLYPRRIRPVAVGVLLHVERRGKRRVERERREGRAEVRKPERVIGVEGRRAEDASGLEDPLAVW